MGINDVVRCSREPPSQELMGLMRVIEELSPYWKLLGMHVEAVGRDCAVGFVNIEDKHLQILGTVHGGVHAALADAMAWVAIIGHYYPEYVNAVTVDLSVKYLRPINQGVLRALAEITHVKEPLVLINARLMNERNELIGSSTVTYWVTRTNKALSQFLMEVKAGSINTL